MMTFSFHLYLECKKLNNTPKFSFHSRSSISHPRIKQHYEINNSDTGGRSKEVFVMKQYISIMKLYKDIRESNKEPKNIQNNTSILSQPKLFTADSSNSYTIFSFEK